jgi:transcriptional regulator with XRE-family HTH domain
MHNANIEKQHTTFGEFITARRKERELPASKICDAVGISISYYCDIEKNRRYPPDREALAKMAQALYLSENETAVFYDLAGKARSEAPPDLPEYINEFEVVRVALRLAKNKGSADDWHRFIYSLESRQTAGG